MIYSLRRNKDYSREVDTRVHEYTAKTTLNEDELATSYDKLMAEMNKEFDLFVIFGLHSRFGSLRSSRLSR